VGYDESSAEAEDRRQKGKVSSGYELIAEVKSQEKQ